MSCLFIRGTPSFVLRLFICLVIFFIKVICFSSYGSSFNYCCHGIFSNFANVCHQFVICYTFFWLSYFLKNCCSGFLFHWNYLRLFLVVTKFLIGFLIEKSELIILFFNEGVYACFLEIITCKQLFKDIISRFC